MELKRVKGHEKIIPVSGISTSIKVFPEMSLPFPGRQKNNGSLLYPHKETSLLSPEPVAMHISDFCPPEL